MCCVLGEATGECNWLVSQSPGVRLLAVRYRCQHTDAQPAVSGAVCCHRGKTISALHTPLSPVTPERRHHSVKKVTDR